ncbi:MAG: hypothetical protein KAJ19_28135 [Gammaproteobacteria bacterium]|nr:hypothetical protein [Gammaproteobacteria bacterium]
MGQYPLEDSHRGRSVREVMEYSFAPTLDLAAYADGDVLFTDMPVASAARESGGITTLMSLSIHDKHKQNAAFDLFFFSGEPATGTYTPNGAFTLHDTDGTLFIGHVRILTTDYADAAASSVATKCNIGLQMEDTTDAHLYVIGVSRDTPDYNAAGDLIIKLNFVQD